MPRLSVEKASTRIVGNDPAKYFTLKALTLGHRIDNSKSQESFNGNVQRVGYHWMNAPVTMTTTCTVAAAPLDSFDGFQSSPTARSC